ncbi:MAG: hypothetical protein GPJ54_05615 [Candidatus Heimdallarchaeota archaeon]|nr:hypothetical protein [Candidatus Heimdallarchaeota archaeon]
MSRRIKKKKLPSTSEEKIQVDEPIYDKNLYDHLKPENRAKAKAAADNTAGLAPVFAVFVIGTLVIAFAFSGGFTNNFGNDGDTNDDNIIDTNTGGFQFVSDICIGGHGVTIQTHYHVSLSIVTNGEIRPLPQGIGDGVLQTGEDSDGCMRPLHTHLGEPGRIHIELPTGFTGVVTLGDFFKIWSNTFGVSVLLTSTSLLDQTGTIVLLESGPLVVSIENPANYQLSQLDDADEFLTLTLG